MNLREAFLASKLFDNSGGGGGSESNDFSISKMTISSVGGATVKVFAPVVFQGELDGQIKKQLMVLQSIDEEEVQFDLLGINPDSEYYMGVSGNFFLLNRGEPISDDKVTVTGNATYENKEGRFTGGDFTVVVDLS